MRANIHAVIDTRTGAREIFLTFRSFQERVCARLATITDGCSSPGKATSVAPPQMLVLIGAANNQAGSLIADFKVCETSQFISVCRFRSQTGEQFALRVNE